MKNEYEIHGDVTAIIINSPKYGRHEALISTSKLERAKEFPYTWCVNWDKDTQSFYVQGSMTRVNGKRAGALLHRWITDAPKEMQVDHKNHNGLNNTDDNLRIVTGAQNKQNTNGSYINSKSGIRGVSWCKQSKKWKVQVNVKGKGNYLGCFSDINEAERVAKGARQKYMTYSIEAS